MSNSKKHLQSEQATLRRVRTAELLKKSRETKNDLEKSKYSGEFSTCVKKLYSNDLTEVQEGMYEIRLALSQQQSPPVQKILDLNILPRIILLLNVENELYTSNLNNNQTNQNNTQIKNQIKNILIEAAWSLTNICTGTHEQTKQVIDNGACLFLINMLKYDDSDIIDQAVWCLGNIAGDCEKFRDILIAHDILLLLVSNLKKFDFNTAHTSIFNNLLWLGGNLLRGKSPAPDAKTIQVLFDLYKTYINVPDEECVNNCLWGLSYIVDCDCLINEFLESNMFVKIVDIINSYVDKSCNNILSKSADICEYSMAPIVRILGHLVSNENHITDKVIQSGALNNLNVLFYKCIKRKAPRIRKEICWMISNITAGPEEHINFILSKNYHVMLIDAMGNYEMFIRREAAYALYNLTHDTDKIDIILTLINNNICLSLKKCIGAATHNTDVVILLLDICINLFEAGENIRKYRGENVVLIKATESKLADCIEDCQDMRCDAIAEKAYNIVIKYLGGEDEGY